jgi:hypothetical protein
VKATATISEGWAACSRGDVALAAGDREDARRAYQQALDIAQQLADRDPGNAQSQRDLAICFTKNSRCALPSSTDFLIRALIITEELEINNKLPIQNKIWIPELQWAIRNIGNVDIDTIERRLSIVDHHTIDNLIYLSAAREMRKDLSRDLSSQTKNIIPEVITMMDDPTSRKIGEIADFLNIPAKSRAAFRRLILDFAAGAQSSMSRRQQWENRKGKELAFTPYDWIKKYYAREITLGALHKGIIRSDDRKLYDALFNWLRDPANQLPDGFLPTKAEWNDRRAIEAGAASNRAEVDPGIKAALSLYDVVRQQQRATRLSRPARPGVAQRFYRRGRSL